MDKAFVWAVEIPDRKTLDKVLAFAKKMRLTDSDYHKTLPKILDLGKARGIKMFICFLEKNFRFCGYSFDYDAWFSENAYIVSLCEFFRMVKERQCRAGCT